MYTYNQTIIIIIIIIIIKKMGESGFVAFILLIAVFCFSKTDLFTNM